MLSSQWRQARIWSMSRAILKQKAKVDQRNYRKVKVRRELRTSHSVESMALLLVINGLFKPSFEHFQPWRFYNFYEQPNQMFNA